MVSQYTSDPQKILASINLHFKQCCYLYPLKQGSCDFVSGQLDLVDSIIHSMLQNYRHARVIMFVVSDLYTPEEATPVTLPLEFIVLGEVISLHMLGIHHNTL